jgi:hypothetical protein
MERKMKARGYEEIRTDAIEVLRALKSGGFPLERIRGTIRFFVTEEELENINDKRCVQAGEGHIAYGGMKVSLFGVPVVTRAGEVGVLDI